MTPEERHLLEETHALAKDNHHMLRSVRRHQLVMDFGKFAVWLVLIALAGYYYVFSLQPAIDKFQATGTFDIPASLLGLPTSAELQKLIDSYKAGQ
jgi:hypothetical protein